MQTILYWFAKSFVLLIQAFPLRVVAQLGRMGGAVAHLLDARHRRVARTNLRNAFPDKTDAEVRAIASEHFKRLGENYASAIKTASLTLDQSLQICPILGLEKLTRAKPFNHIVAIGHFGNFELYVILNRSVAGYQGATTYRALPQPGLNRMLDELRKMSGILTYERRSGARELMRALDKGAMILGVLSDQHAGAKGVWAPFFGTECSTTPAPAVLALRYNSPLHTAIIYRVGLGRWQVEVGDEIPTHENGHPRTVDAIMQDVNKEFEAAIRRDPANWFWVHKRWKPKPT